MPLIIDDLLIEAEPDGEASLATSEPPPDALTVRDKTSDIASTLSLLAERAARLAVD